MTWYVPSWNGDLRLEPVGSGDEHTLLSLHKPTEGEKQTLGALLSAFGEKEWKVEKLTPSRYRIERSLADVGPVAVRILKPGPAVLTAVRLVGGKVETCEHSPQGALEALAKKEDIEAAATVSRPTPCCPRCYVEAVGPATEVLLSFLSAEQHETWARSRQLVVRGGLTGHRYVLMHRHSPMAARNGRIAWDADDKLTMHFHDWSVPPEEEVLSAMLILRHREHWLRNEATCVEQVTEGFYVRGPHSQVFRNPFGDMQDGVMDASLTRTFGLFAKAMTGAA